MLDALFVYGSLMPHLRSSFGAAERARLASECAVAGPARVAGALYDLGAYPGLLLRDGAQTVRGTLLTLRDPAATFAWLDRFEDIEDGRPADQQIYDRVVVRCVLGERSLDSWVYAMRRVPPGAKSVAADMWHAPSP